ncbi:MAG TPA: hypothetical protein VG651_05925 [Stellaceae bacterium]|nr:hypothetical protein [Stellaceae bacterium]
MSNADSRIFPEIIPPESRGVRMPAGTPFGVAILGAARFNAIRRVIEQYERALRAQESAILAEAAIPPAMARREVAREQLRHLDELREEEGERISHAIGVAKLRRELERMELEDQIAERRARRAQSAPTLGAEPQSTKSATPDDFTAFMDDLRKMPEVVQAVSAAKEQIVKQAGGEQNLSEAQSQTCEMLDAMLHAFMSKKSGEGTL